MVIVKVGGGEGGRGGGGGGVWRPLVVQHDYASKRRIKVVVLHTHPSHCSFKVTQVIKDYIINILCQNIYAHVQTKGEPR